MRALVTDGLGNALLETGKSDQLAGNPWVAPIANAPAHVTENLCAVYTADGREHAVWIHDSDADAAIRTMDAVRWFMVPLNIIARMVGDEDRETYFSGKPA